jgi:hypothetical protein
MWLAVFLAWIGVKWFDGGLGWVWLAFVITTTPAAILMWWIFKRRVHDYELGRVPLPELTGALAH